MVGGDLVSSHARADSRRTRDRLAARALQAGLTALFCLFVLFASFGPWFHIAVAYGLASAAMAAGIAGLVWAHATSHHVHGSGSRTAARTAGLGALASVIALGASAYLVGLFFVLTDPVVLPVFVGLVYVFTLLHFASVRNEREG